MQLQRQKKNWVWPAVSKVLGNLQLCQQQSLPVKSIKNSYHITYQNGLQPARIQLTLRNLSIWKISAQLTTCIFSTSKVKKLHGRRYDQIFVTNDGRDVEGRVDWGNGDFQLGS